MIDSLTPDALLARIAGLGIDVETAEHPPVFTVEEAKRHRVRHDGVHTKNLFLRNKKKQMWLVTTTEDQAVDLKALGRQLGAGNVSFGSPDRLREFLGVEPGSVTPLAVVNDTAGAVEMVLDRAVLQADPVHCHPLVNTMTTAIRGADLVRFLESVGHAPQLIDMP
jgi:Ala-tRNA(Pro) deacylase